MRLPVVILLGILATHCLAQSPEKAAERYFAALAESDEDKLAASVFEPSAERIGKSIIAAAPMFHHKGATEFFEMIFDRVPPPAEIAAMTPIQAFAAYMCDPLPNNPDDVTDRTVLGVVYERDDLAHVVYRVDGMPSLGETHRDLLTCAKSDRDWQVIVPSQVWEAYMSYLLRPAMAKLSEGNAEQTHALEPAAQPRSDGTSSPPAQ